MHPGTCGARLHEPPKLTACRQERTAGATYHAGVVLSRFGIDDGWRIAIGAREFVGHLPASSQFVPNGTASNNGRSELLFLHAERAGLSRGRRNSNQEVRMAEPSVVGCISWPRSSHAPMARRTERNGCRRADVLSRAARSAAHWFRPMRRVRCRPPHLRGTSLPGPRCSAGDAA